MKPEVRKMRERKLLNAYRIIAGVMCSVLTALFLLSFLFIAEETGHDCSGEDCSVCESLEQCRTAVRRAGEILAAAVPDILFAAAAILVFQVFKSVSLKRSLVSQKVRLND